MDKRASNGMIGETIGEGHYGLVIMGDTDGSKHTPTSEHRLTHEVWEVCDKHALVHATKTTEQPSTQAGKAGCYDIHFGTHVPVYEKNGLVSRRRGSCPLAMVTFTDTPVPEGCTQGIHKGAGEKKEKGRAGVKKKKKTGPTGTQEAHSGKVTYALRKTAQAEMSWREAVHPSSPSH